MSKQLVLAYCIENSNIAKKIDLNLSRVGYSFEHITCSTETTQDLGDLLNATSGKVLLLISDNLLRSRNCMNNGMAWFPSLTKANRVFTAVIDGRQRVNGEWQTVPTSFERVSNVIKYMNFWQDQYLDLRKNKRNEVGTAEFNEKLRIVRAISSEVGDFLRHLRSSQHFTQEQLEQNNFKEFFSWNNDFTSPASFVSLSAPQENKIKETIEQVVVEEKVPLVEELPPVEEVVADEVYVFNPNPKIEEEIEEEEIEAIIPSIPGLNMLSGIVKVKEPAEEEKETIVPEAKQSTPSSENKIIGFDELIDEVLQEEKLVSTENLGVEKEELTSDIYAEEEEEDMTSTPSGKEIEALFEEEGIEETSATATDIEKTEEIASILRDSKTAIENGDVPEALNKLKDGIQTYPEEVNLRFYYAYLLAEKANNPLMAKSELNNVLQQFPSHTDAHYLAGELAEFEKDYWVAKNHFSDVVKVNPDYPNAQYRLGHILFKHFANQEEKAFFYLKNATKQDKTNLDALLKVAYLYENYFNKSEKAYRNYEKVLRLDEHNSEALLSLARLEKIEGNKAEALNYYRQAVDSNPNLATSANQSFFAPELLSDSITTQQTSTEDNRLQELEAKLEELQAKLAEKDQQLENYTLIANQNGYTNGNKPYSNGNGHHSINGQTDIGIETEEGLEKEVSKEKGKVVFITGATSGIGKATAHLFAEKGYRIIMTGRRLERLEAQKEELQSEYNTDIKILNFDVRQPESVFGAIKSLGEDWSNIDVLINNAGLAKGFSAIHEGEMHHWEQMIDTNIKGLLYMTRAVSPYMVERRSGHIINVCSTAGHEVYPNGNVYCATKHAVDALTKSMRIDLHKHNVRVSQVSPGHVEETEFAQVRFDGDKERAKIYEDFKPLRSKDVAEAIFFMATRPAYVNIQDILMMGTQQANSNYVDRSGR